MNTIVLTDETARLSMEHLLSQANQGGVEVRGTRGELLAYVLSPTDRDAWTYAEANLDIDQNIEQLRAAMKRRGGVTTKEMLEKAARAAEEAETR